MTAPGNTPPVPWRLLAARYLAAAAVLASLGLVVPAAVVERHRPGWRRPLTVGGALGIAVVTVVGGLGWWISGLFAAVTGTPLAIVRVLPLALATAAAGAGTTGYAWDHRDHAHPLGDDRLHGRAMAATRRQVDRLGPADRPASSEHIVLGAVIDGDLPDAVITVRHIRWLTLPASWLTRHLVLVGETGTGKTVTALTIVYAAASAGWRVIYLDAKADRETRDRFEVVVAAAGQRLSSWPPDPFDGWRGGPDALLSRLMRTQQWTEPFYETAARDLLSAALDAPGAGPVTDWPDLLDRLNRSWMTAAWAGDPARTEHLAGIRADLYGGVASRFWGTAAALGTTMAGDWGFDDANLDCAYVALGTPGNTDTAVEMSAWVVEDIIDAVTQRLPGAQDRRPTLVVADEFSRVSERAGRGVVEAVERCRGFGCGWLVVGQDLTSLGDQDELPRILGAAGTRIAHRLSDPEVLCNMAGTVPTVETTTQTMDVAHTGLGSSRRTERYVIAPQAVRRLPDREAVVIARGHAATIRVIPPQVLADHLAHEQGRTPR